MVHLMFLFTLISYLQQPNTESTVQVVLTSYTVSGGSANTVSVAGNSFYINSGLGILSTVSVGGKYSDACTLKVNYQLEQPALSLWSAPVTVSLHSVLLKSANFDVIGSAPANSFANLGLYANGVQIATSTGINSMGYIAFDLTSNPYTMITGATTLEVRGDIVNGSARTAQLSLQNASDLMVTDSQVGVNVSVLGPNQAIFSQTMAGLFQIQPGSLVLQLILHLIHILTLLVVQPMLLLVDSFCFIRRKCKSQYDLCYSTSYFLVKCIACCSITTTMTLDCSIE